MRITSEDKARADGIEFEKVESGGQCFTLFHIPCPKCGAITKKRRYVRKYSRLCEYCKKDIKRHEYQYQQSKAECFETKEDKRFQRAVDEIKSIVPDFDSYEQPIAMAKKRAAKYASIPEAMVAIELLKEGYRIIPQQKIGHYKVDFCLPDEKVIIEVDGSMFHQKPSSKREATIQFSLGLDWKIIHVPAEEIRKKIWLIGEIINKFKTM